MVLDRPTEGEGRGDGRFDIVVSCYRKKGAVSHLASFVTVVRIGRPSVKLTRAPPYPSSAVGLSRLVLARTASLLGQGIRSTSYRWFADCDGRTT